MSDQQGIREEKRWIYWGSNCNGDCTTTTSTEEIKKTMSAYLGLSFGVFLGLLPKNTLPYVASLQSRNRVLALRLFEAEERLRQIRARRREDGRANARAAEILAEHRSSWLETERGLLNRLDDAHAVESELRAQIESLERELSVAKSATPHGGDATDCKERRGIREGEEEVEGEGEVSEGELEEEEGMLLYEEGGEEGLEMEEMAAIMYQQRLQMPVPAMDGAIFHSTNANWFDLSNHSTNSIRNQIPWQDLNYDSVESMGGLNHARPRRESPWKIDLESSGVPNKLRVLEEELTNLENVGKGDLSKIPSLMRKQAKRYQNLSVRIDDLCKQMRASDPYDPSIGAELRAQRQNEFLMEAFRLQHRATETRHKLGTVQSETLNISSFSFGGGESSAEAKLRTKRSLDSIRNNFKDVQRNLEVWLARILGDLEGMIARDGASRMRKYTNVW